MDNNLSKKKKIELANMFLSNTFSIYEFEKVCGLSKVIILNIFRNDLYEINKLKAYQVNRVLEKNECLTHKGYMREIIEL